MDDIFIVIWMTMCAYTAILEAQHFGHLKTAKSVGFFEIIEIYANVASSRHRKSVQSCIIVNSLPKNYFCTFCPVWTRFFGNFNFTILLNRISNQKLNRIDTNWTEWWNSNSKKSHPNMSKPAKTVFWQWVKCAKALNGRSKTNRSKDISNFLLAWCKNDDVSVTAVKLLRVWRQM